MDFFGLFSRKSSSKDIAKSRLKFVLVQDRLNCSSEVLEMLKADILKVISSYMEIEDEGLDIQITQMDVDGNVSDSPMLYANIPIKKLKKK